MPGPKYVKNFEFPSSAGFAYSGGTTARVRAHDRKLPPRPDSGTSLVTAIPDMANDESGITGKKFRPGFKKGGMVSKAEDKKDDKAAMARHNRLMHPDQKSKLAKGGKPHKGAIAAASAMPKPKLGKGNYGSFGKKPMIGE
jgi:hypothetical protein